MLSENEIIKYLNDNLRENRFKHSISVSKTAVQLAKIYNENVEKAKLAGLIHDCAKNMSDEKLISLSKKNGIKLDEVFLACPQLLHGNVGAIIAKDVMGVLDEDILNSIRYHTTGRKNMSLLEKIIYIADYIEPLRNFDGVEKLRKCAYEDIDNAMIMALDNTINYVLTKKQLLQIDTINLRNYMLLKVMINKGEKR